MSDAALAVILATRNRGTLLRQTLASIDTAQRQVETPTQVIVVDNGSTDATSGLLIDWCGACTDRQVLRVEKPGKSRAINAGLVATRAPLVTFTDDDVEVSPHWLSAILTFFAQHCEFTAAMGRTLPPQGTDPELLDRIASFPGAVPLFDGGSAVRDLDDLFGCNMAVRRSVFDQIGGFNERLGPGASGLSEDADLARRIQRAGMRIGYMPDVVVYHEVDPQRLTETYYREFRKRLGRSEYAMHPEWSYQRALRRLVEAVTTAAWASVTRQSERRARAWERVLKHADALAWTWREAARGDAQSRRSESSD